MKDGTETGDSRLGRLREFDARNWSYPVMAKVEEERPEPRSYTWRQLVPVLDQGSVGACVAYSIANEGLSYPGEIALADEFARRMTDAYLLRAYCKAQKRDPWPGTDHPRVCGELAEDTQYGGTSVLAGLKVFRDLGFFGEFRWARDPWEAIIALGRNGPAIFGGWWYEGMYEPDEDGFVYPTGEAVGGHAYMYSAVDVTGVPDWKDGVLDLRNNWGPQWGGRGPCDPGEAKLRIRDFISLFEDDGECAFVQDRTWKPESLREPEEIE